MVSWKVDGVNLDNGNVRVIVVSESMSESTEKRVQKTPKLRSDVLRNVLGSDDPVARFRFQFTGPNPDRYNELEKLRAKLLRQDEFTLEAPSDTQAVVHGNYKVARFSAESIRVAYHSGLARVSLDVEAAMVSTIVDAGGIASHSVGRRAVARDTRP